MNLFFLPTLPENHPYLDFGNLIEKNTKGLIGFKRNFFVVLCPYKKDNCFCEFNPDYTLGLKAKAIRRIDNDCRQVR